MNSCKNCEDRHLGCHSTCKDYLRMQKEQDRIREERAKDSIVTDYFSDRARRVEKSYIKKKKRDMFR